MDIVNQVKMCIYLFLKNQLAILYNYWLIARIYMFGFEGFFVTEDWVTLFCDIE